MYWTIPELRNVYRAPRHEKLPCETRIFPTRWGGKDKDLSMMQGSGCLLTVHDTQVINRMCVCVCVCIYIYISLSLSMCVCARVCVWVCVPGCVCMHMYVCIYTYI